MAQDRLFLSPSTQEYNPYIIGGNEEYYTNLIADAMEPYLFENGVIVTRNDPEGTVGSSVRLSNAGDYDLHLALHTNAAPEALAGQIQGPDVYYYSGSSRGRRAAEIYAENLARIYPDPSKINVIPTTSLYELRETSAPAVLIELAYHDNVDDANWIKNNINAIVENLALATLEYFRGEA